MHVAALIWKRAYLQHNAWYAILQAVVIVPLILVLMLGFGTTLTVCYNRMPHSEYSSLAGALRTLMGIIGGQLDLMVRCWTQQHCLRLYTKRVLHGPSKVHPLALVGADGHCL